MGEEECTWKITPSERRADARPLRAARVVPGAAEHTLSQTAWRVFSMSTTFIVQIAPRALSARTFSSAASMLPVTCHLATHRRAQATTHTLPLPPSILLLSTRCALSCQMWDRNMYRSLVKPANYATPETLRSSSLLYTHPTTERA